MLSSLALLASIAAGCGDDGDDGGKGDGSDGGALGASSGSGTSGGAEGKCGDTTSVASFFASHEASPVALVYDAGAKGGGDVYATGTFELRFSTDGQLHGAILFQTAPQSRSDQFWDFATQGTYEDSAAEVNVIFKPEFGYAAVIQCEKASGAWTLAISGAKDPTINTRFRSR